MEVTMTGLRSIEDIENEVIEEFDLFTDLSEKTQHIMYLGRKYAGLPEIDKTNDNVVKGCQARVWLISKYEEGRIIFKGDSDSTLVKGLAALLIRVLSNHTPD